MKNKVKWGVLSTALIGLEHLIPALKASHNGEVRAIASRSLGKAEKIAQKMAIPRFYGSYEDLLKDEQIDAVYNPLPNHLHVPWTLEAIKQGKHVLCEKPAAIEAKELLPLKDITGEIIFTEAFMVRFHLQWKRALEIVKSGRLGEVRAMQAFFSYYNDDPHNIRNIAEIGGGAMYDIGCYPTVVSRYIFGGSPIKVVSLIDRDPNFKTDRLTSAIYDYGEGRHLTLSVSTQLAKYQRVNILGSKARLEMHIPFNAPINQETKIIIDDGTDLTGKEATTISITACNQYQLLCEAVNEAILGKSELIYGAHDAIENAKVIDAVFKSAKSQTWEKVN